MGIMLRELQPVVSGLKAADRSFQKEKGRSLLLRGFPWFLGIIVAGFLLDAFLHLGSGLRLLMVGLLLLGSLAGLGWSYFVSHVRRNQLERIARILESRDPALGSRLINILQLESQTNDPNLSELTRQMAQHAIGGYADQLRGIDFQGLAKSHRLAGDIKRAALAGLAFGALLLGFYRVSITEVLRFADPWGDHPPYSFTRLEIQEPADTGAQVVYNKNLIVKVKHSGYRPSEVFLTYYPPDHPRQAVTVPMFDKGGLGFYQELANVKSDLVLYAHTKDRNTLSKQRRLKVLLTPRLEKALVRVTPPVYTGLGAEETPFEFKNLKALAASDVRFHLESNRPLRQGMLEIIKSANDIQRVPLALDGEHGVSGSFAAKDSALLKFEMTDADGIASEDNWQSSFIVTHDLPPEIHITSPNKDCFVAFNFKTEAQIEASDDYGLKTVRIHRALNQVYSAPKVITYDKIVRNTRESLQFAFADLGVKPGDVISLFAEAIDTAPESHLARSETINLTVISEQDYNDFLREQNDISDIEAKYTDLLDQLNDLVEQQKKLGDAADALRDQISRANDKEKAALQQSLDKLLAQQNELNQKLQKAADQMDKFVRDQPLYDVEAEFQKALKERAQDIRNSAAANDKTARDVAQRSSPPSGKRQLDAQMAQELKRASDEQIQKLGGAEQQAEQEMVQTVQDMALMQEMLKDFNHFKDLYQTQQALSEQTRAYNRAGQLSREDQLALKDLAATEKDVADQLRDLEQKLRSDSKDAQKLFPKAAQSAKDLADKMQDARMQALADQATGKMLAGEGESSFQLSDRLRSEMEKLFGECQSQGGQQQEELDTYLKLQRGMNPGRTFSQMMQSHKFGNGQGKSQGMAMGTGAGQRGTSGFAVMEGPSMGVLGNESFVSQGEARQTGGNGRSHEKPRPGNQNASFEKPDAVNGVKPVNRKSEAVTSESTVDQYSDIVDQYFKKISK
jgi:ElaB/YqjD/DUF883 family membrane-anchored ribosome-binding protein